MPPKSRAIRKKVPEVLGFPTEMMRKELLQKINKMSRRIMSLLAVSAIETEEKEELANFFLFVLNVLDIEHAKIEYEKVKPVAPAGGAKALSKK